MDQIGIASWRPEWTWIRGPARICGDEVILDEERADTYHAHEHTSLLFDLSHLGANCFNPGGSFNSGGLNLEDLIAFVRRHGLLWHGPKNVGTGECRESLKDWQSMSGLLACIIDFYTRLKEADASDSAEPLRAGYVDWVEYAVSGLREHSRSRGFPNHLSLSAAEALANDSNALKEYSSLLLGDLVSAKLENCNVGIMSSLGTDIENEDALSFALSPKEHDLETSAYVQLAMLMVQRVPLRSCPGCGRMFVPKSGKQTYHSKSCASTSRWRRWKESQSE